MWITLSPQAVFQRLGIIAVMLMLVACTTTPSSPPTAPAGSPSSAGTPSPSTAPPAASSPPTAPPVPQVTRFMQALSQGLVSMQVDTPNAELCEGLADVVRKRQNREPLTTVCNSQSIAQRLPSKAALSQARSGTTLQMHFRTRALCEATVTDLLRRGNSGFVLSQPCT